MLHLSFEGIVHRDLATRNILLSSTLDAKISDFGMSRKLDHIGDANKTQQEVGPLKWMVKDIEIIQPFLQKDSCRRNGSYAKHSKHKIRRTSS